MDVREILAVNLRKYRRLRDISQEELAYRADIDRTYVSLLERQKYSATIDTIGKLAAALDIDPDALLKRPGRR